MVAALTAAKERTPRHIRSVVKKTNLGVPTVDVRYYCLDVTLLAGVPTGTSGVRSGPLTSDLTVSAVTRASTAKVLADTPRDVTDKTADYLRDEVIEESTREATTGAKGAKGTDSS